MEKSIFRGRFAIQAIGGVVLVVFASASHAFTPRSPEVRTAIKKAMRYLEQGAGGENRPGGAALVGLVSLKQGADSSDPLVERAVTYLRQAIEQPDKRGQAAMDIYSTALAIVFFANLDAQQYRPEIELLLGRLETLQMDCGGWGYPSGRTGDTSMTQNVVLCFWELTQAGYTIPVDLIDSACSWFLRTQDPGGAFGYQGKLSKNGALVRQSEVRPSMAAAGLGSLYICADLLQMGGLEFRDDDLPPGLKEVKKKRRVRTRSSIDPSRVHAALSRGDAWMGANFTVDQGHYNSYYLYTLERYHTFRELARGKVEKEPRWYNEGVRHLLKTQKPDGSWSAGSCGVVPGTAFHVLFLLRSTLISVEKSKSYGEGTLIGGRGLPKFTADAAVVRGQVVAKPELAQLDRVLAALDEEEGPDRNEALKVLAELPSSEAERFVVKHAKILVDLAGGASPDARLAAVSALGKTRNLDHVPTLIYALTDPEPRIVRAARDGLRRMARKFDGFGLPDDPDDVELDQAIRKWRAWFLAIRPDASFED